MKKIIVMLVFCFMVSSTFAVDIWGAKTAEEWDKLAAAMSSDSKKNIDIQTNAAKYILSTDLSKVSYDDFKAACKERKSNQIAQLVFLLKPANKYIPNVLSEKEAKPMPFKSLVLVNKRFRDLCNNNGFPVNDKILREWCKEMFESGNIVFVNNAIKCYKNDLLKKLSEKEILEDMKYAKKINYNKITKDDWKSALVEIELIIKSVQ